MTTAMNVLVETQGTRLARRIAQASGEELHPWIIVMCVLAALQ